MTIIMDQQYYATIKIASDLIYELDQYIPLNFNLLSIRSNLNIVIQPISLEYIRQSNMTNPVNLAKREVQLRILQLQNNLMKTSQKQTFYLKQYQSIRKIMNRSLQGHSSLEGKLRFLNRLLQQKRSKENHINKEMQAYAQQTQDTRNCTYDDQEALNYNNQEQEQSLNYQRTLLEKQIKQNRRKLQKEKIIYGTSSNSRSYIYSSNPWSINSTKGGDIPQPKLIRMKSQESYPISQLEKYEITGPFNKQSNIRSKDSVNNKVEQKFLNRQMKQLYSFRSKKDDQIQGSKTIFQSLNNSKNQDLSSIFRKMANRNTDNSVFQRTTQPFSSNQNLPEYQNMNTTSKIKDSNINFNQTRKWSSKYKIEQLSEQNSQNQTQFEKNNSIFKQKIRHSYVKSVSSNDRLSGKSTSFKQLRFSPAKRSKVSKNQNLSKKQVSQVYKKIRARIQLAECMNPKLDFNRSGDLTKIMFSRFQHQKNQRMQAVKNVCVQKWHF